jgi:hypothetical protein
VPLWVQVAEADRAVWRHTGRVAPKFFTATIEVAGLPDGGHNLISQASDSDLEYLIEDVEASINRLRAVQLQAVQRLASRHGATTGDLGQAGAIVGGPLGVTARAAETQVVVAGWLDRTPRLADAMLDGQLSDRKAGLIIDTLAKVDQARREELLDAVLPTEGNGPATYLTPPRLKAQLKKVAARLDATYPVKDNQTIAEQRQVSVEKGERFMSWLYANIPTDAAATFQQILTEHATHIRDVDDVRTLTQRRADALCQLIDQLNVEGPCPICAMTNTNNAGNGKTLGKARKPLIQVTVPAFTLLGLSDHGARIDHYGPIPADVARRLATDATWQTIYTHPLTGYPIAMSRKHQPGWVASQPPNHPPGVNLPPWTTKPWFTPFEQIANWLAANPPDPDLLPPDLVEAWKDSKLGSNSYQPSPYLDHLVRWRDQTCRFPGCNVPALYCDIDHSTPYQHDKPAIWQTTLFNLHCLCRTHHRAKTFNGWRPTPTQQLGPTGQPTTHWTGPTGRDWTQ